MQEVVGSKEPSTPSYASLVRIALRAAVSRQGRRPGDNVIAVLDQGLYSATSFITIMVIARHAPSTELGTFSIGLSIFWMTIGLMMSFVSTPLVLTVQGVSDEAYR